MVSTKFNIIKGKSTKGKDFEALQFVITTPYGDYKTGLIFPSPFELNIIKHCQSDRSTFDDIYHGDTSPENEGF